MKTVQLDMSNQITIIKLHVVFVQQGSILYQLVLQAVRVVHRDPIRMRLDKPVAEVVVVVNIKTKIQKRVVKTVIKDIIRIRLDKAVVKVAGMELITTSQGPVRAKIVPQEKEVAVHL